jgi:hypothetical protein
MNVSYLSVIFRPIKHATRNNPNGPCTWETLTPCAGSFDLEIVVTGIEGALKGQALKGQTK